MEIVNKPPYMKIWKVILRCLLAVIFLLFGAKLFADSMQEGYRYRAVKSNAVKLVAVGAYVDAGEDSEGDEYYDLYVAYTYQGTKYTTKYNRYGNENEARGMVGKEVEITINPDKPREKLGTISASAKTSGIFAGMSLGVGVLLTFKRKRKLYTEVYGWYADYIEKDVHRKHFEKISYWIGFLVAGLCYLIFALVFPEFLKVFLIAAAVALGMGIRPFGIWCIGGNKIRKGQYRSSRQTLVDKKIETDSDGDDTYYLCYSAGKQAWRRSVPRKKYQAAQIGETVEAVFLEGAKNPFLVWDPGKK